MVGISDRSDDADIGNTQQLLIAGDGLLMVGHHNKWFLGKVLLPAFLAEGPLMQKVLKCFEPHQYDQFEQDLHKSLEGHSTSSLDENASQ